MKIFLIIAVLIFFNFPAYSYIASGTGVKTCNVWLKNTTEAANNPTAKGIIWASTIQWIRGYISALNFLSEMNSKKYKDINGIKGENLIVTLQEYCLENQNNILEDFTLDLWSQLPTIDDN
ncbi:hypothetical protein OAJ74_04510 [Alphaproteobacteria bacterium]|nr:hypothetical protein [Alphaproteobacteria bacterium]